MCWNDAASPCPKVLSICGLSIAPSRKAGKCLATPSRPRAGDVEPLHTVTIRTGLGALKFDSVLLHEVCHIWMHRGRAAATPAVSEGVARLTSYWYLGQHRSPAAAALQSIIGSDSDEIYGDGFRAAREAERRHGWITVRQQLLIDGTLP